MNVVEQWEIPYFTCTMNAVIVTSTQIKKVAVHTLITSPSSKCQLKIQKVFISNQYDAESQHSYLFVLQKNKISKYQ